MLNDRLEALKDYPFARLRELLAGATPPAGLTPITMSIGEPSHPFPGFVGEILAKHLLEYGKYPPILGTPEYRQAAVNWLGRRYKLPAGLLDAEKDVVALSGTKEGLFMIAQAVVPSRKAGAVPLVAMPDPFYQVYAGGGVLAGAELLLLPARRENNFMPDYTALTPTQLDRLAAFYLCTPSNPQGTVADLDYMTGLLALARKHDFVLILDECYAEIYSGKPPSGGLEAAMRLDGRLDNLVVFHSLSKRSSVPGMRIGFVAGDPKVIAAFGRVRNYGGATIPFPILHAGTALWNEDTHAEANRGLYQKKFAMAERLLGNRLGFYKPAGGFFLWLDVGDSETAARRLYEEAAITTLPGAYLAKSDDGTIGRPYLRVALVNDLATTEEALTRIRDTLG